MLLQVFAVYLIWILLLTLLPTWYKAHRQHLVAVLRLALGIAQVKFYNAVGYLVYDIGVYENAPLTSVSCLPVTSAFGVMMCWLPVVSDI